MVNLNNNIDLQKQIDQINEKYKELMKKTEGETKELKSEIKELLKSKVDISYTNLVGIGFTIVLLINTGVNIERFNRIDERFNKIDERFNKIDKRLDKMDERFTKMDEQQKELNKCVLLLQNPDVKIKGVDCNLSF